MTPFLDLRQLRIFLSVARLQSVKDAARELGLSPPAVSQAVSALETSLKTSLFSRAVRPLELTVAGRTLVDEGARLLQHEAALRSRLSPSSAAFQSLKLGVSEAVASSIGPWLTQRLGKAIASLSVFSDLAPELQAKLVSGEFDVTLCSGPGPEGGSWLREELWREEFLLVSPRDASAPETADDLRRLADAAPFICYNRRYRDQQRIDQLLDFLNVTPKRRLAVSSSYELMGLIALSRGFSLLPPTNIWCGRQFFDDIRFSPLPLKSKAYRQMWATGAASDHASQTRFVAQEARGRMAAFRADVLARACPGLEKHLLLGAPAPLP